MLSSNWHVTLWLTVFEIFADKWPKFRPKIWDFGNPLQGTVPTGQTFCPAPTCTIMQNFTPIDATVAEISVTGERKKHRNHCNIPSHTPLRYSKTNVGLWFMKPFSTLNIQLMLDAQPAVYDIQNWSIIAICCNLQSDRLDVAGKRGNHTAAWQRICSA